eukprot:gnl/TRDRNA2_/TRDRNA2_165300_c0_seq2.p1 gnl/TRDRNA2_/TRDRNA2_165300_c0~~gnl/TRDRNA2_/TRDRNA2_165300_c0_seq2.p1  ORF type:complete len:179 (-),score=23.24 gnl/TRDRNA2_/TRDRNA2_165300_c0_seq2:184-720(-)
MWDLDRFRYLHQGSAFHEVLALAFGTERFRTTHCGNLMAKPAMKTWHRDAPDEPGLASKWDTYAASLYIPLMKMTERSGVTEFLIGSHKNNMKCEQLEKRPPAPSQLVTTAGLSAGDVIIFDVRLCHRGVLHTAPELGAGELGLRPVATLNFGIYDWEDKEDINNWGERYLVPGPHGQ